MLSEKGFSLIEVLLSLTILSVSVIGISQFYNQANQISSGNNNKLVATNLARMTLERVQHDYSSFDITSTVGTYNKTVCQTTECQNLYEVTINNIPYNVEIGVQRQSANEVLVKLFPVKVTIKYEVNNKVRTTAVEGYVKNAD
jgi:prepilin-type N-terminal cleavage/methylation domain-containing protein